MYWKIYIVVGFGGFIGSSSCIKYVPENTIGIKITGTDPNQISERDDLW